MRIRTLPRHGRSFAFVIDFMTRSGQMVTIEALTPALTSATFIIYNNKKVPKEATLLTMDEVMANDYVTNTYGPQIETIENMVREQRDRILTDITDRSFRVLATTNTATGELITVAMMNDVDDEVFFVQTGEIGTHVALIDFDTVATVLNLMGIDEFEVAEIQEIIATRTEHNEDETREPDMMRAWPNLADRAQQAWLSKDSKKALARVLSDLLMTTPEQITARDRERSLDEIDTTAHLNKVIATLVDAQLGFEEEIRQAQELAQTIRAGQEVAADLDPLVGVMVTGDAIDRSMLRSVTAFTMNGRNVELYLYANDPRMFVAGDTRSASTLDLRRLMVTLDGAVGDGLSTKAHALVWKRVAQVYAELGLDLVAELGERRLIIASGDRYGGELSIEAAPSGPDVAGPLVVTWHEEPGTVRQTSMTTAMLRGFLLGRGVVAKEVNRVVANVEMNLAAGRD